MQLSDIKNLNRREGVLLLSVIVLLILAGYLLIQNQQLRTQNAELQVTVDQQNKKIENLEKLIRVFNKDFSDLKGAATDAKAGLGKTLEKIGEVLQK